MKAHLLGFCGTAKNTGKTTTMKAIMDAAIARNMTIALTSIGYDGELVDHITSLPKPRVYAVTGTLLAIADSCAKGSTAEIEIIQKTDINTALGKVIIGRVRKPGLILLAGPTKSKEIRKVNQLLDNQGCDLILVDGALNRIAPMVEMDGIILSTGASRNTDISELTAETQAISSAYKLPVWPKNQPDNSLTFGSILDDMMADQMMANLSLEINNIFINGIIGEKGFKSLLKKNLQQLKGKNLIIEDPIKLLVSGSPLDLQNWLNILANNQTPVFVKRQVDLRLITINPFYPQYRYASHDYEAAYVDKDILKNTMQAAIKVPIVNVLEEKEDLLLKIALNI